MGARVSEAFAPAAISNFFAIHDEGLGSSGFFDYSNIGATGGGFTLSRGVYSRATIVDSVGPRRIKVRVNGNPSYRATTTRRAIELLLDSVEQKFLSIELDQRVEVPIGYGFGTSAAAALSAVLATSSALGLSLANQEVAYFAHAADIICQTGLGTVSSIWNHAGVGVIVRAGAPGVAKVTSIPYPRGLKVVAATLAPFKKSRVLSSGLLRAKVNRLGEKAVSKVASNPTLGNLTQAAKEFADKLNLASPEIKRLIRLSLTNGAIAASQNMIGQAAHAIVTERDADALAEELRSDPSAPSVIVSEIGAVSASTIEPGLQAYPPTVV